MDTEPDKPAHQEKISERPLIICLLLAVVTLAVYLPAAHYDFVNYDDPEYFTSNPHVLSGLTPGNVVWAFTTTHASNWHPVTWLSLMLDAQLFGQGPVGPHLTNLLFHAANAALLFLLLRRLAAATWRSALVAALFALHPMHVESVAWVAERKDVLSAFFGLLSLWAYARYAQKQSKVESRGSRAGDSSDSSLGSRLWTPDYGLAVLFFALGLMSKPVLVTLPLVMLLLDWWPLQRWSRVEGRRSSDTNVSENPSTFNALPGQSGATTGQLSSLVFEKWPFLALSAISCVVTFVVQQKTGAVIALTSYSLSARIENAFVSYARYLGKLFWPASLATPYPHPGHWPLGLVLFAVALFAVLCVAAIWCGRKFPFAPVGWFWFVGMLVPVIGLVQVGDQAMADRYTYLPLIGALLVFVWGVGEACSHWRVPKPTVVFFTAFMLAVCALQTRDQLGYWQNSGTLFRHALAVTENNYVAENDLGTWLANQGQVAEAMDCYRQSLKIKPGNVDALYDLGNAFARLGDWDNAIADYRHALEIAPAQSDVLDNLGLALAAKRQYAEAIADFEAALKLNPDSAGAHNNLATVLFMQHRFDEAAQHYREALRLTPDNPQIYVNLGDTLVRLGRVAEAMKCYQAALQLKPDDPKIEAKLQALGAPANLKSPAN
jgi:Flp pilus assembly protein TadD